MKNRSLIVAAAALIFLSSADSDNSRVVLPEQQAPELILSRGGATETLEAHKGHYVILNFWNARNPASRIANVRLDRMSSTLCDNNVDVISVCTDTDHVLYTQLLTVDDLDEGHQYHYSDSKLPSIVDDYALADAPRLYLVSPSGTVVAIADNPEALLAHVS